MSQSISLTYASSISDLTSVNSSFDKGILRICYAGKNQNGSSISKDVITKSIPTMYNCPIVCNYDRDTDSIGGHDMAVKKDDDGNLKLINLTTPVGVIPESANIWWEDYTSEDGTTREYLYAEALLWKRQEAYEKIKADGITSHSMEISVKSGEVKTYISQAHS